MTIPKSYSEITIAQFDELREISLIEDVAEREKESLCVLLNCDPSTLKTLSVGQINEINESVSFLKADPKSNFNRIIEIDGIKYGFISDLDIISLGEWIDEDFYSSDFDNCKHNVASILWRKIIKEDELGYQIEEYDGSRCKLLAEIFKNKMSYQDLWGGSVFFSLIGTELLRYFPQYLTQ